MNFSLKDVKQLYGSLLFRIPESEAQDSPEAPKAPSSEVAAPPVEPAIPTVPPEQLKHGASVTWKLKPDSTLALIISASDYGNKELTGYLKQCLLQSGVPLDQIGFGVFPDGATEFDLQDIPTAAGILFCEPAGLDASPIQWLEHTILISSPLSTLSDESQRQSLILRLKQAQEWMNPS